MLSCMGAGRTGALARGCTSGLPLLVTELWLDTVIPPMQPLRPPCCMRRGPFGNVQIGSQVLLKGVLINFYVLEVTSDKTSFLCVCCSLWNCLSLLSTWIGQRGFFWSIPAWSPPLRTRPECLVFLTKIFTESQNRSVWKGPLWII